MHTGGREEISFKAYNTDNTVISYTNTYMYNAYKYVDMVERGIHNQ